MATRPHFGKAEFTLAAQFYPAAQLRRHGLHAVANAQYRHAGFKDLRRRRCGGRIIDRLMTTRQDDAL